MKTAEEVWEEYLLTHAKMMATSPHNADFDRLRGAEQALLWAHGDDVLEPSRAFDLGVRK